MTSLLSYPVLSVTPDNITFSSRKKYEMLQITNIGKSSLEGSISTNSNISVLPNTVFTLAEGETLDVSVQLIAHANNLPKTFTSEIITIESNGGTRVIPVVFKSAKKSVVPILLLFVVIVFASYFAVLRYTPPKPEIRAYSSTTAVPLFLKKATATPIPSRTATKRPTWTPTPTIAPNPILVEHFSGLDITKSDQGTTKSYEWNYSQEDGNVVFKNGNIIIQGESFWRSGMQRKTKLSPGEGFLIDYKYSSDAEFEILMDYGEWQTKAYRRFGFYPADTVYANYWVGTDLYGGALNLKSKPDVWYSVFLSVSEDNEFYAMIWEKANPSNKLIYKKTPDSSWANKSWEVKIGANSGLVYLQNYTEFSFNKVK